MPVKISLPSVTMALEFNETCFFQDDTEEFYEDSLINKDLFKKFELHTPPQSPPHNPFPPDDDDNDDDKKTKLDKKSLQSALEVWDECSLNLTSNLIQDCMWSGPCLAAAGLISPKSKKAGKMAEVKSPLSSPTSSPDSSLTSNNADINSSECVSPAAVFPDRVNETPRKKIVSGYFDTLGSVAETPSPSESEDEEEIDVVTVTAEKMARKRQAPGVIHETRSLVSPTAAASFKSHVASMHNYSNTQSPPASFSAPQSPQATTHHCGGHKRSRPISMPASPQPAKKARSLLHATDLKRVAQKLKLGHHQHTLSSVSAAALRCTSSSRNSSDSEEGDVNKRAQHNVLERKRRNDLKYSFLRLRDNVPELAKQERTPKVTILKQSADFLRQITRKNQELESELQKAKSRFESMKKRLMMLRRECL